MAKRTTRHLYSVQLCGQLAKKERRYLFGGNRTSICSCWVEVKKKHINKGLFLGKETQGVGD